MSWQSALACWFLRRQFRPQTLKPDINVGRARALTAKRVWVPSVPRGWVLREQYRPDDAPLRGEWLEPSRTGGAVTDVAPQRTILYLHGGGYYFCSPQSHRSLVFELAKRAGARTFSLDYRLAPEHRFPAALEDAVAPWRRLLADGTPAGSIVIAGDSAGGGLALATLVALRDAGDPMPAGAVLFSPWTDLAATGDTIRSNDGRDPMFSGPAIVRAAQVYLGDAAPTHPYASPLYADLRGLPPLFMQAGETEVLLDDTRRVAAKAREAGVQVECEIWPKMPHVWHIFAPFIPEAGAALDRAAAFVNQVTSVRAAQSSSETSIV
ncbi:alpha/beta hydrolase [Paraburkholderia saeva]|uniref:alpha/beta hydrolase n=1 Tax=Paraburkholderia saeva TaxID=2777537 RepID=UPI001DA254BD|nr:alpha/beta hydrolase [Paraburkholderia saeva]CAG4894214.1 Monoterpene epsilon-lactone hydrolase [Paraburkholderia saeva]